jgi:glycoprotein endo-alpha-1,2-mannosidase
MSALSEDRPSRGIVFATEVVASPTSTKHLGDSAGPEPFINLNPVRKAEGEQPPLPLPLSQPSKSVHIFYYNWYGNPEFDGEYLHWNHEILDGPPNKRHRFEAPNDIGAPFYPLLGCYSSNDPGTVAQHMQWISKSGAGVVVVSWYPTSVADEQNKNHPGFQDHNIPLILNASQAAGLEVAFHIEPYPGRTPASTVDNVRYLRSEYGSHPAFYAIDGLPVVYVYDSYLNKPHEWRAYLAANGQDSVRGTNADAIYIGLPVTEEDMNGIAAGSWDGFYTYFATDGFTYPSTQKYWPELAAFAQANQLRLSISLGPGYSDLKIRPWNPVNQRSRQDGEYYQRAWSAATKALSALSSPAASISSFVSLTSFNEWHEGTQLEPVTGEKSGFEVYPHPMYYLEATAQYIARYLQHVKDEEG